jgi:hypothetical protein
MKKYFLLIVLLFICSLYTTAQSSNLQIKATPPSQLKLGQSYKLKTKVVHHITEEKTGGITCTLLNAATHKPVDGWFINIFPFQYFTTIANTPFETEFSFTVPHEYKGAFEIILVAQVDQIKDSVHYIVRTHK